MKDVSAIVPTDEAKYRLTCRYFAGGLSHRGGSLRHFLGLCDRIEAMKRWQKRRAFTLIEILAAAGIVALLTGLAIPTYTSARKKGAITMVAHNLERNCQLAAEFLDDRTDDNSLPTLSTDEVPSGWGIYFSSSVTSLPEKYYFGVASGIPVSNNSRIVLVASTKMDDGTPNISTNYKNMIGGPFTFGNRSRAYCNVSISPASVAYGSS